MFAYCRNNPVSRIDIAGTADLSYTSDDDGNPFNDFGPASGGGGGGGTWDVFMRTMQSAANGLNMACGAREGVQKHHLLSNKNSKYKPKFRKVTDNYKLSLDGDWNTVIMENHRGRHTNAYHEFMLDMVYFIDNVAQGSQGLFLEGFQLLADFVVQNNWIPYG